MSIGRKYGIRGTRALAGLGLSVVVGVLLSVLVIVAPGPVPVLAQDARQSPLTAVDVPSAEPAGQTDAPLPAKFGREGTVKVRIERIAPSSAGRKSDVT